jgi:hypothetical protein
LERDIDTICLSRELQTLTTVTDRFVPGPIVFGTLLRAQDVGESTAWIESSREVVGERCFVVRPICRASGAFERFRHHLMQSSSPNAAEAAIERASDKLV